MDVLRDHQVETSRSYVAAQSEDVLVNSKGAMFPSIPASTLNLLPRQGQIANSKRVWFGDIVN